MDDSSGDNKESPRLNSATTEQYEIPVEESDLRSILSMIDDAVFIFAVEHTEDDLIFTFQWSNPAHELITGMTINEFGGLRPKEFLGEEVGKNVAENYRECVERRETIKYEETLEHEKREIVWNTKLIPVIEDDTVVQILGMSRNVTELAERTKHLQVVDRVLRHDLRNELNVIRGQSQEIQAETDSPIADEANWIIQSSNNLLDTAEKARKIDKIILDESQVTTLRIDSLLNEVTARLSEKNYEATISVAVAHSATISAIPRLPDAIVELVENAVEHHDKPEPTVKLVLTEDEDVISLKIADDGPGIPGMQRVILTNGQTPSDLSHGVGLGMWLVYWIVYRSDGEITVTDRKPRGSVVTLRLPRIVEDQ